jgi:hypothetical protein
MRVGLNFDSVVLEPQAASRATDTHAANMAKARRREDPVIVYSPKDRA